MKLPFTFGFVVAGLTLAVAGAHAQNTAPPHDTFYFIGEINKAFADSVPRADAVDHDQRR